MPKKVEGWLGADLIFDVDDEHIRGIEGLTYAERLSKVKNIVHRKLLNDFLLDDFGFDEKHVRVAFSGSRGYHIHIRDPKVLELGSIERREIVDYIIGLGLDYSKIFVEETFELKDFGAGRVAKKIKISMPHQESTAWKNRMRLGIQNLLNELENIEQNQAIQRLLDISKDIKFRSEGSRQKKRLGRKNATEIYNNLFSGEKNKRGADRIRTENVLEIFSKDSYRNMFIELVKARTAVEMAGETDEPVTTDVKRLIRMPSSIHGKTGLKVVPLALDKLESFEPLRDAVVFGEAPVKINVNEKLEFELKGQHYTVDSGETELPEYAAVFLMCQRKAVIVKD
ncbi:MAG: DNA primase catalytic subunit PriS, partial [Thermoplasmata archaeon]|nr:DNA primase catalytic subunit PriS [Thermoplasmata archaeon]